MAKIKTIKLCEGHKGGFGFMKAFGIVKGNYKVILVDKSKCVECKARKKK